MANNGAGDCWLIDLDGVVWLANDPIPGSREALAALRAAGHRVAYFTNNSFSTREQMFAKFAAHGIALEADDLLSSAQAAAALVESGSRATVLGGRGIVEALEARKIEVIDLDGLTDDLQLDAVVVGLDRGLTFGRLSAACAAVSRGAKLIATNNDATYPTPDGVLPGAGSMVAAVAYSTGVTPVVAGKPYPPAVQLANSVLGSVDTVVGDRPETDGEFARGLGARFGIVRSGVTPAGAVIGMHADLDAPDLASLVAAALGTTREQIC